MWGDGSAAERVTGLPVAIPSREDHPTAPRARHRSRLVDVGDPSKTIRRSSENVRADRTRDESLGGSRWLNRGNLYTTRARASACSPARRLGLRECPLYGYPSPLPPLVIVLLCKTNSRAPVTRIYDANVVTRKPPCAPPWTRQGVELEERRRSCVVDNDGVGDDDGLLRSGRDPEGTLRAAVREAEGGGEAPRGASSRLLGRAGGPFAAATPGSL